MFWKNKKRIADLETQIVLLSQSVGKWQGRFEESQLQNQKMMEQMNYMRKLVDSMLLKNGYVPVEAGAPVTPEEPVMKISDLGISFGDEE